MCAQLHRSSGSTRRSPGAVVLPGVVTMAVRHTFLHSPLNPSWLWQRRQVDCWGQRCSACFQPLCKCPPSAPRVIWRAMQLWRTAHWISHSRRVTSSRPVVKLSREKVKCFSNESSLIHDFTFCGVSYPQSIVV